MCGGRGTRLDAPTEKPLLDLAGRPMVDHVTDALAASRVGRVHAVVSPRAPETRAHLSDLHRIETPGEGYVPDLRRALERVDPPVLTVAADLPLLSGPLLDGVLDGVGDDSTTICVPAALKEALGASVDAAFDHDGRRVAPTGVNLVADGDTDTIHMSYDARLAINVNRPTDADLAEALL